jgi:serine/threonine protein kinase
MLLHCPNCNASYTVQDIFCKQCGYKFLHPGQLLAGRYRIDKQLGAGGFGVTFRAFDTGLNNRPCVIKQLVISNNQSPQEIQDAKAIFEREAQMLIELNQPGHPNIPEIYAYLESDACLVMKYIEGRSLEDIRTQQGGRLPISDALRYIRDVCSALVYMHTHPSGPVLHRDIKPENIMLDSSNRIWLIDFGLSKTIPPRSARAHTKGTIAAGTIGYTPVEQWQQKAEPRSDVYALAATLHSLITGFRPPWSQTDTQGEFPPARKLNPAVSAEIEELIQRAMSSEVSRRPTAQEFLAQLDSILQPTPILEAPDGTKIKNEQELARWSEQHWQQAVQWLYDRDKLPSQIERLWGKNKLAKDLRGIVQQYTDNQDAGLDAALALLDPVGFGVARPTFRVDKQVVDFGSLAVGVTSDTMMTFYNSGRRYTKIHVTTLPVWLSVDTPVLSLPPGQSRTVKLTVNTGNSRIGGALHTVLTFNNGNTNTSVKVQAAVSRWRTLLLSNCKELASIITAIIVLSLIIMGYMLAYNTGITIAEYYRQYREVAPIARLIGAYVAGFFLGGFCLLSFLSELENKFELVFAGLIFFFVGTACSYEVFGWLVGILVTFVAEAGFFPFIGIILGAIVGVIIASKTHKFILQGIMSLARI